MKKIMLLALAAVSALLALPAFASATPVHLEKVPGAGNFTVHGLGSELSREAGGGSTGETTEGTGKFENTTTGTLNLTFRGVSAGAFFPNCASAGHTHASKVVTTTALSFHLITAPENQPSILITPPEGGHFATYTCTGLGTLNVNVKGNGVIGEITSPKCNGSSATATVKFNGANGVQTPQEYTGTNYTLESSLGGAYSKLAMNTEATITFEEPGKLICT